MKGNLVEFDILNLIFVFYFFVRCKNMIGGNRGFVFICIRIVDIWFKYLFFFVCYNVFVVVSFGRYEGLFFLDYF